ncbi:MAG: hypothetical protein ABIQ18_35415 [Umezawaea sp.]
MTTDLKTAVALVAADTREQFEEEFTDERAIRITRDELTVHDITHMTAELQDAYRLVLTVAQDEIDTVLRG